MRLIAVLLLAALPASAQNAEARLKPIINEMLAAVAPGDTAPWKKYLDERKVEQHEGVIIWKKVDGK